MKKLVIIILLAASRTSLFAQDLGVQNSNYAGIQGALLNPSSIAGSPLKWDINILSGDAFFAGNFLYAPVKNLRFFGFGHIIKGSLNEELFGTRWDPNNPNKKYDEALSTTILGPSFFVTVHKKHEIGLTMAARAVATVRNITGNLGENAFAYFQDGNLWNTNWQDNSARVNGMAWMEYGVHYATVLYTQGENSLKGGISLNYLVGAEAAYAKNTNLNYRVDSNAILVTNSSLDYGQTDFDHWNDLNKGQGVGFDLGFTYVHGKEYRLGLSLLDVGSINFKKYSGTYHLATVAGSYDNWYTTRLKSNQQINQAMSAVFYGGDSTASFQSDHFRMSLPTALSLQADWKVYQHYFLNFSVVQGFGNRPNVYAVTPRYETSMLEVSLPVSLINYGFWQPRVGVAVRFWYFFIGGDALGGLTRINELTGMDFYAGIHYFFAKKS
jgi:hypothetical protein